MDLVDIGTNLLGSPFGWIAALGLPVAAVGISLWVRKSDLPDGVKKFVVVSAAIFVLLELPTVIAVYLETRESCRSGTASSAECLGVPGV